MTLRDPPREVGQIIFYVLTGASLFYCLMAGVRSTADCLSEEKREGTLGLLFLTDLRGYDVVVGKLVANSLNAFYGVMAVVPVMAIPLLLGGVTVGEFGRVAAVLVNTLFFSLCMGIFASSMSKSSRKAIGTTVFLLLLFTILCPAFGAWLAWRRGVISAPNPTWEGAFALPCAAFTYAMGLDRTFTTKREWFYWSLGTIHVLSWVFLALASLIAPRLWQDRPAGARRLRLRERWEYWCHGDAGERKWFRDRLLDLNSFYWLAARPRQKPAWVWAVLGLVACVWTWGVFKYHDDWFNEGMYMATAILVNSVLKGWLASEAGRQLTEDRRIGALELLLSTPLTVPEILRGQRLALQRQFLGPVVVVLCAEVLMVAAGASNSVMGNDRIAWTWMWLAGMAILVADLVSLYWVGMWMGLSARNPKRAFSGAVTRILALPWIGFAVFLMFVALAPPDVQSKLEWKHFLGVWFALGLAADIGFGYWARQKLLTEFRLIAAQRFQRRPPWWKRLFGAANAMGADLNLQPAVE
jgi:ABC-type Na+ efflux pump permease subunit